LNPYAVFASGAASILPPGIVLGSDENMFPISLPSDLKLIIFQLLIYAPPNSVAHAASRARSPVSAFPVIPLYAPLIVFNARSPAPIRKATHARFLNLSLLCGSIFALSIRSVSGHGVSLSNNPPELLLCVIYSGLVYISLVVELFDQSLDSFVLGFVATSIKLSRYFAICGCAHFISLKASSYPTAGRNGS